MRLLSLQLENYRRYKRLEMEFPDGVIAIVGDNGSGKSTMVESIAWALYGNKPEIVRAGRDSLKWTNAPKGEGVKAVLRFQIDDQEYELERTLKGAVLSVEGQMLANGLKPVEEKVVDLLRMEYKEFSASIYARQKELNLLSQQRPEERRKLIHRLLGITSVEDARGMARADRRRLEERVSGASSMLYKEGKSQLEKMIDQRKEMEKRLGELETSLAEVTGELENARNNLASMEKEMETMEAERTKMQGLQKETAALTSEITARSKRITRLTKEIEALEEKRGELEILSKKEQEFAKLQETRDMLEEARSKWEKINSTKEELKKFVLQEEESKRALSKLDVGGQNKVSLEEGKREAKEQDTLVEKAIQDVLSKRSRSEQELDHIVEQQREGHEHLNKIRELGGDGTCPTCERPLEGHYEVLEQKYLSSQEQMGIRFKEIEEKISSFSNEITSKQKLRGALQKKQSRYESELNQLVSITKEKEMLQKQIARTLEQKTVLEKEIAGAGKTIYDPDKHKEVKEQLRELAKEHTRYIRLKESLARSPALKEEKEDLGKQEIELKKKLETLEEQIKKIDFNDDKYNKLRADRRAFSSKERKLSDQISSHKAEKARSQVALETSSDRIKELERSETMMAGWNEEIRYLHRLAGARPSDPAVFSDFLSDLTNRIRPVLRSHSTELFNMITENRYGGLELDEDYSIGIYDSSSEPLPISRFSGGEEDVANLSLRIAVSRALSERSGALVDFIILDEIFGSQDIRRRENILQALDRLSGVFRQVFVISHVASVKDQVSYIIKVEDADDGSSVATVE